LIGYGKDLAGLLILADEIRKGVKDEIKKLFAGKIKNIIMLTGDNQEAARAIAKEVGIKDFHANLLPEDKVKTLIISRQTRKS
jgi:Zn2+/Cd2+-exporting ATPase